MSVKLISQLAVLAFGCSLLAALALGKVFPRLGHRLFGWHVCDATDFDGCSLTGRCRICGKDCMMDSQGNWF